MRDEEVREAEELVKIRVMEKEDTKEEGESTVVGINNFFVLLIGK